MNKLITHIKRLALALCFAMPCVSWAADAPTITIDGTTVTINNETATTYDSSKTLTFSDAWQQKGFWLPTGTDFAAGTMVKVTSIAFAVPSDGNFVDKIGLAGCTSASAVRTAGGFTTAGADKVLFSFADSECLMRVNSGSQIWFLDSEGAKVANGTEINFTIGASANQYIDNLVWSGAAPVIEVVGEILTGSSITGALTAIGNSGTDPLYAFGVTGWLDTENSKTGPIVLVEDNSGAFSIGLNNANSVNANGRCSTWSKLSGSGSLGAVNGQSTGTAPVLEIYDASEFTGSIVTDNGGPKLSVVFCTASESSTLKTSYNSWFNGGTYANSLYVSENSAVTVPAGKTWQASKLVVEGAATINGTFNGAVVNNGNLTVNGTVTGAISGNGTVVVNEGATVASFGSQRDFTGWTVDSSVPVKITMTAEEYGKGSVSVTGANGISTVTVYAPDGTTEAGTITPDAGAGTLTTDVKVSGKACWYAWEMNGNLNGSGANTGGLSHDTGSSDQNAFYNSSMLYTYRHPYTSVTFPATWTAVVRCTVPKVVNGTVITFGTKFTSFIGLIAGDDPETEMKLVRFNAGDDAYTVLASMPIIDGTSAQHVYIFSVENNTDVKVYCDGSLVLDDTFDAFALGSGIQIGSAHGGVAGGLVRMWAGDTYAGLTTEDLEEARIDCVRLYNYSLSAEQVAALSVEFPAVKLYRATAAADADTTWGELAWSPAWDGGNNQSKVILTTEGDAAIELPETITADQLQLSLAADSTLTLAGPGSVTVTEPVDISGGTLELTGTVTLTRDTAFNGKVSFAQFTKAGDGAIQLANGATVGVDAALVVTPLGTYTCAEGTVVDSAYDGEGVKLIPLTSAVVSIAQSGTTLYYSDLDTALGPLVNAPITISDDVVVTLLNGTTLPAGYDTYLKTAGYYIDGNVITKAVARITSTTYPTFAAAVAAATDGATVTLLLASSEEITLNKAITLSETANFSGTLTGNGTLTFAAFRNNPSITFDNWTGTVVLPSFEAGGTVLNNYGVTGSTVVLKGITGGWFGETAAQTMTVAPVLQLDGNVTITGFSPAWDYTFAEITGTGTFSLAPTDNNPKSATITKVGEGFTGTVASSIDTTLAIGTLARVAGTSTAFDTKLLGATGNVVATALTVGGESVAVPLDTKEDGIYVGAAATVTAGESVTSYSTLAAAVAGATDGATVTLLADVTLAARVEPNVGAGTALVIDLNDFTITPTVTCGNGSAFDVKSGNVTIKNGAINGSAITTIECDPITARSGSDVTLEDLEITICSQSGACAYPFTGAKMTIKSGTYKNTTTIPYQWQQTTGQAKGWTGMAVNQGNVATQLLFIEGGTFSQVNPALGDDSWEAGTGTFLAEGKTTKLESGMYVVVDDVQTVFDGGDGSTFTIADPGSITIPAGKSLTDSASDSLTYAQAWVLGLLDNTGALEKDLAATIEVTGDKVVVKINGTPRDGYEVWLKVFTKPSLAAEWSAQPTEYKYDAAATTGAFAVSTAGFYKVQVSIKDASVVE